VSQQLEEAERHAKQYDADLIRRTSEEKRPKYRKAISKAEEILKLPQVCLVDEKNLKKLLKEIKRAAIQL
jgi:hypothetical protein